MEDDKIDDMELMRREARDDFLWYMSYCDPNYIMSPMHAYIAGALQEVYEGKIKRLAISVPPQTGKSKSCSVEFPCWCLGKNPKLQIAAISYSQAHINTKSRMARDRMNSQEYQEVFPTRISRGDAAIEEWGTQNGGKYIAVGVMGSLTGKTCDCIIIDDPVKDWQEAIQPERLSKVWDWYWSVVYSRIHPNTSIVVLSTRWSRLDLIGRLTDPAWQKEAIDQGYLKANEQWKYINLPALAHEDDPLGRLVGESVFPEKFPREHYEATKLITLPYIWSALYEGNPVVAGGNQIDITKLHVVDAAPEGLRWARGWDLATDDKKQNDETAGAMVAIDDTGTMYIKDVFHKRLKWPDARTIIAMFAGDERVLVGVETVAGFKTAYDNLMEVMPQTVTCVSIPVNKDKFTRALPWVSLVANNKVRLVNGPWVKDFILQAQSWTGLGAEEDDMIDAISLGYQLLIGSYATPIPLSVPDRYARAMSMRRGRSLDG